MGIPEVLRMEISGGLNMMSCIAVEEVRNHELLINNMHVWFLYYRMHIWPGKRQGPTFLWYPCFILNGLVSQSCDLSHLVRFHC